MIEVHLNSAYIEPQHKHQIQSGDINTKTTFTDFAAVQHIIQHTLHKTCAHDIMHNAASITSTFV